MLYKGVYWHVFPTYTEAKDAVWRDPAMLQTLIPKNFIKKKNEADLVIELVSGSILQLKGADKPERLLGSGPRGIILDEFAEMKIETWQRVVEPIVRANNGWTWFVGTPKGRNHLYDMYRRGQIGHKEWKSWLLPADTSGIFTKDQLIEAQRSMTQALFRQEMMCDFLENEGVVFRGVREAADAKPKAPIINHMYVMGVDLAKVQDYTVISVFDRMNNEQVFQDRFHTMEYPAQKVRIKDICEYYNHAVISIDATGIGDPVVDDLLRFKIPVEPVKITEINKKEMIEKLSIWLQLKKCAILPIDESFIEYDNFSYEIGPTGKIRYEARQGYHDDIILSHALAVYQLAEISKTKITEEITPIRRAYLERQGKIARPNRTEAEWDR